MRFEIAMLALCVASLLPISASAQRPSDVGTCEVLVRQGVQIPHGDPILLTEPFTVTVAKGPGTGSWFNPIVTIEVVVPFDQGVGLDGYSQIVVQTYNQFAADRTIPADFIIPLLANRDDTVPAVVFATVSEPLNPSGRKTRDTECEAEFYLEAPSPPLQP